MALFADTTFDGPSHAWTVELHDLEAASAGGHALRLTEPPRRMVGSASPQTPIPALLPTRVELSLVDDGTLAGALAGRADTDFRLDVFRDGGLYFRGPLKVETAPAPLRGGLRQLDLTAYDGLTLLKGAQAVGETPSAAQTITSWMGTWIGRLPVGGLHTYTDWQEARQGEAGLHQVLALTEDVRRIAGGGADAGGAAAPEGEGGPTAYAALQHMARLFGATLVQGGPTGGGAWHLVQRSYRAAGVLTDRSYGAAAQDRDLRVQITDGDILDGQRYQARRRAFSPARSAVALWSFEQDDMVNAAFDDDTDALYGWDFFGGVWATPGAVHHSATGDYVEQAVTGGGEWQRLEIHGQATATGGDQPVLPVAQLEFRDTLNQATYYYVGGSANWQTAAGYVEIAPDADGFIDGSLFVGNPPGSGTGYYTLRSRFDPDPDGDGTNEYSEMVLFELALTGGARTYDKGRYTASSAAASRGARRLELKTPLGSVTNQNPVAAALRYADGTDTGAPGSSYNADPFLAAWLRDVGGQQVQRLAGLDVWLGPGAPDCSALSTLLYEGLRYAPVYEEEVIGRGLRRLVAYEVRSDDIGGVTSAWHWKGEDRYTGESTSGGGGGGVNDPPTADFAQSTNDLTVSVDASESTDPEFAIASYDWEFGDGETGSGQTASHTYSSRGLYTITLTLTDDAGQTDTHSQDVYVQVGESPAASFQATELSQRVNVDASASSDPDGSIVRYDWDWGDGTTTQDGGAQTGHSYAAPGTYDVLLTVHDDDGNASQEVQTVTV